MHPAVEHFVFVSLDTELQRRVLGFGSLKENFPVPLMNQNKQTFREFHKYLPVTKDLTGAVRRNNLKKHSTETSDHFKARKFGQCSHVLYKGCFNYSEKRLKFITLQKCDIFREIYAKKKKNDTKMTLFDLGYL